MNKTTTTRKPSEKRAIDSESPTLDKSFFATAVAVRPDTLRAILGGGPKQQITLRIDQDVIEFFKAQGKGYQRLMNFALRGYMLKKQEAGTARNIPKRKAPVKAAG
jgi:uncharacterized protein (DUF4415 family)